MQFHSQLASRLKALAIPVVNVVIWLFATSCAAEGPKRVMNYDITLNPEQGKAEIVISVPDNQWLRQITMNLRHRSLASPKGNGKVEMTKDSLVWVPTDSSSELRYQVPINKSRRQNGSEEVYRAYHTPDWFLMRLDDLVPPFKARFKKGPAAESVMTFHLPKSWGSVYTSYPRLDEYAFNVTDDRKTPRPSGWLIGGSQLSARHEQLGKTTVSFVGPMEHQVKPMELLALTGVVWPSFVGLIGEHQPQKLLVVSANDPLWRGGLSADHSMFIHAARPLISENGTSTLIHELFHVLVGVRAAPGYDWITEGLAEFYSIDLLARAGAYSPERRAEIFTELAAWGDKAKTLKTSRSSGPVTAKAAVLFSKIDNELQQYKQQGLDALVGLNVDNKKITLAQLRQQFADLTGKESKTMAEVHRLYYEDQ